MSKSALFLSAFLLSAAALGTVTALRADEPAAAASRWEYRVIAPKEGGINLPGVEQVSARDFMEAIRHAGADGWQLTAFDPTGGAWLRRAMK
jgi:hypothetical protein